MDLCLWSSRPESRSSFRARLLLSLERLDVVGISVLSIDSANQGEGLWRYAVKLQVPPQFQGAARFASLMRMLKRDKRLDCHVKRDNPPPKPTSASGTASEQHRPRRRARGRCSPLPSCDKWPVISLNVNGTRGAKRDRLQWLLDTELPGVLCLQETLRPLDGWRRCYGAECSPSNILKR